MPPSTGNVAPATITPATTQIPSNRTAALVRNPRVDIRYDPPRAARSDPVDGPSPCGPPPRFLLRPRACRPLRGINRTVGAARRRTTTDRGRDMAQITVGAFVNDSATPGWWPVAREETGPS